MTVATDPVDRAEIDSVGGNSAALPLAQSINGWNGGDFLEYDKLNVVMRNAAQWKEWLDQTRADTSQLGFSSSFRCSATQFGYGTGIGLVDRLVQDDSYYVVFGRYVPLTLARLLRYQPTIHTHTFTASKTHHFYVDAGGEIIIDVVPLATPPLVILNYELLVSVDTDATGITGETRGPNLDTVLVRMSTALEIAASLTVSAPALFNGGNVTIDKANAGNRRIDLTVDGLTTVGWRILHNSAERLIIQELISGVATDILDLGTGPLAATTAPIFTGRPVAITSTEILGGLPALAVTSSSAQGPGSTMTTDRTAALTLSGSGVGGVPLVLVPRGPGFVGGAAVGSVEIGNDAASNLQYKDNNSVTRNVWATQTGLSLDSAYTLANVNNFAGAQIAQTFNYSFIAGQRYLIKMACRVGRHTGSTRDALFTCTVGGVALAFSGQVLTLWQGGGVGELEQRFEDEVVFTAGVSGTLAVQLLVTPNGGAGNLNIAARSCCVLGHFD